MASTETPALSVIVFGERTSLPITITKAVIRTTAPIPFVQKSCTTLQLSLTNDTVEKDVAAKLHLAMPLGASVKKFELQRNGQWYPATAVPKQKAQAVVYKEKEKGRAVAAVSNSAKATNVFEMEISPLPYKTETLCRLELLTEGGAQELVDSLMSINGAEVLVEELSNFVPTTPNGGAVVGNCFGKTHFLCQVPSISASNETPTKNTLRRVAVFWDASASMKDESNLRCSRLSQLFEKAGTETVELYVFGIGAPERKGTYGGKNLAEVFEVINSISYDGGTDLTTIPETISQLANRQAEEGIDAVLVFTDGVDNIGRLNEFNFGASIPFPVHCIADTSASINMSSLKALAAASAAKPGVVISKKSNDYVRGILFQQPILQSILVDQDEDAFLEETEDGFSCVPDHRLKALNIPIPSEGLCISGTVGDSVTKLTARVLFGDSLHLFHYRLRNGEGEDREMIFYDEAKDEGFAETHHECNTVLLDEDNPAARILGHVYAEERYLEAESFGIKSGQTTEHIKTDLAVSYGFCSPESTLLMLYEPEQFEEHGIRPPEGHPAAQGMAPKKREQEKLYEQGEVGGLKSAGQRERVASLAKRMQSFFTEKVIPRRQKGAEIVAVDRSCCERRQISYVTRRECRRSSGMANYSGASYQRQSRSGGGMFGGVEEEGEALPCTDMFGGDNDEFDEEDDEGEEECYTGGTEECYYEDRGSHGPPAGRVGGDGLMGRDSACGGPAPFYDVGPAKKRLRSAQDSSNDEGKTTVSPPRDLKSYMDRLGEVLFTEGSGDSWKQLYKEELDANGSHESASPSFFLNTARVLIRHSKPMEALCIATNCLETGLEDVQLLRSVGYVLLSSETQYGLDMAIDLFEKVRQLAPLEPQSFLDISLAKFWKCWKASQTELDSAACKAICKDISAAQEGLVHILTHAWTSRFEEVEWPVLVLLHYIRDFVREINKSPLVTLKLEEWPRIFEGEEDSLCMDQFDPALMVWLGWDTDHTDVDLHVLEPSGEVVYFSNKRGTGSLLSRDFRQGYGPEVYLARNGVADAGTYQISAKYYASHQDSKLTGTTSVMVWVMEKNEGKTHLKFDFVRLDTNQMKTVVGTAAVEQK